METALSLNLRKPWPKSKKSKRNRIESFATTPTTNSGMNAGKNALLSTTGALPEASGKDQETDVSRTKYNLKIADINKNTITAQEDVTTSSTLLTATATKNTTIQ